MIDELTGLDKEQVKDLASIRQVLAQTAPDLPTEGIYEIDLAVNSEDCR